MKTRIRYLALLFVGCASVLLIYLIFLHIFPGAVHNEKTIARSWVEEGSTLRGKIIDRNGLVLAETKDNKRVYPLGKSSAHLVGYLSKQFGKSGLELYFDRELLGLDGFCGVENSWRKLAGQKALGNNLVLTLDADLQETAYRLLEKTGFGAAVVLEPATGKILAAASSPSFYPDRIEDFWQDETKKEQDSSLFNRAFQGLYPPGSTFKLVSGTVPRHDSVYHCLGYVIADGRKISCTGTHGVVDYRHALAYSCNSAFISMALDAGADELEKSALLMGFNQVIPFDFPVAGGIFPSLSGDGDSALAACAVGQGEVLATPLLMALVVTAAANEGVIMRPYLVEKVIEPGGKVVRYAVPKKWLVPLEKKEAEEMRLALEDAVEFGTGKKARITGTGVAGKTGTAQVKGKTSHAWFVGFAPSGKPQVAAAVVVENGGTGGEVAAPLAKELIKCALDLR